mmetsp:Transcript_102017/g.176975  ORF Transcript_102017/g.176975 Transcript_102017/m.176975 type:complete len:93 (-) Transcript_102017:153-431(-)
MFPTQCEWTFMTGAGEDTILAVVMFLLGWFFFSKYAARASLRGNVAGRSISPASRPNFVEVNAPNMSLNETCVFEDEACCGKVVNQPNMKLL